MPSDNSNGCCIFGVSIYYIYYMGIIISIMAGIPTNILYYIIYYILRITFRLIYYIINTADMR